MDTKKSCADNTTQQFSYKLVVELEGVEPSSKQGNHTFSTCLSWPSLSGCDKTQATNHNLIL